MPANIEDLFEGEQVMRVAQAWKSTNPETNETDKCIFHRVIDRDFDSSAVTSAQHTAKQDP